MGLWIFFVVLFMVVYAAARGTRGDKATPGAWLMLFVLALMLGLSALDVWMAFIHQYEVIVGPLIAKHGMSIPTTADVPGEIIAWSFGTPIAGLVLALVSPWLATAAESALAAVASWIPSSWRSLRGWLRERIAVYAQARLARALKRQETAKCSPRRLARRAKKGARRILEVAKRNPKFWEGLLAYVRVLSPYCPGGHPSELTRLLNWIRSLDRDIRRIHKLAAKEASSQEGGFSSNKSEMLKRLEERRGQALKLASLVAAMLDDTDDDMCDIERDIPSGLTYAQERRDALIADFRTALDQIELVMGLSHRRAREETIRLADEEVALLTSGELRAVAASEEIDDLLRRLNLGRWEWGTPLPVDELAAAVTSRARPRRTTS